MFHDGIWTRAHATSQVLMLGEEAAFIVAVDPA